MYPNHAYGASKSLRAIRVSGGLEILRSALFIYLAPALFAAPSINPGSSPFRVPVRFERGPEGKFAGKGFGYKLTVESSGYQVALPGRHLRASIEGANPNAEAVPEAQLRMKTSYLHGNKKSAWRTGVENFERVHYNQVLPGVDVAYHTVAGQFEFDFVVHPGADPHNIAIHYDGHDRLDLDSEGNLVIAAAGRQVVQQLPAVYQRIGGNLRLVNARYTLRSQNQVAFALGAYDHSQPLVIDPVLAYTTFVSGNSTDTPTAMVRDANGYLNVVGTTRSTDLVGTDNDYSLTNTGDEDVFILRLDPTQPPGQDVLYLTYFGGSGADEAKALAVDGAGRLYITGTTLSTDFPATVGSPQQSIGGDKDAFIAKFDLTIAGTDALVYATYFGGTGPEVANAITLDSANNAYIVGYTGSGDMPLAGNSVQSVSGGGWDAFLAVYDGYGGLSYSTYLGADKTDQATAVALAIDGSVIVGGNTSSSNFPLAGRAFDSNYHGGTDAFIARIDPSQGSSGLLYATFLGGSGVEDLKQIKYNAKGQLVAVGSTQSANFPVTLGAYQSRRKGTTNVFVTTLDINNPPASALVYSTYLGGSDNDIPYDFKFDATGQIVITGYTYSDDYPVTQTAFQPKPAGGFDAFMSKLDLTQTGAPALVYSTFLGGPQSDIAYGVAVDAQGVIYMAGTTNSRIFPLSSGVTRDNYPGDYDGFIVGIQPCAIVLSTNTNAFDATGGSYSFQVSAASDCSWKATSNSDWAVISDPSSGRGNGTVSYAVAANPGDVRVAKITVADQVHTITQAAK